jgi:hypothetical protein
MAPRRTTTTVDLPHSVGEVTLADGRRLEPGQNFTLEGGGRYRFLHIFIPDGSVTAYGPVSPQGTNKDNEGATRSFRPDRIKTIHRQKGPT